MVNRCAAPSVFRGLSSPSLELLSAAPAPRTDITAAPAAVVDIGSNSVRLVVFDGVDRTPFPIYNERVLCGLGADLARTGRLNVAAADAAIAALRRFAALARAMGAASIEAVATAAVRDAVDGADFVDRAERAADLEVRVLSGDEEARLSAHGLLAGIAEADGVMADLGGGSLELVDLVGANARTTATLALGPLHLASRGADAPAHIDAELAAVDWLRGAHDRTLYLVGGGWRTVARVHMAQTRYPLRVIHRYAVRRDELADLAAALARLGPESLARMAEVPARRRAALPLVAITLVRLLAAAQPPEVVFSAYGLREGLLHARLPESERRRDPLIAACQKLARRAGRFGESAGAFHGWIDPLFAAGDQPFARLRHAACLLGDIAWASNPDQRAAEAFRLVMNTPTLAVDHAGRATIGLALHARYDGAIKDAAAARRLIDHDGARRAESVGLALRLGYAITGGATELLDGCALAVSDDALTLTLGGPAAALDTAIVARRLHALAAALDRTPRLETVAD